MCSCHHQYINIVGVSSQHPYTAWLPSPTLSTFPHLSHHLNSTLVNTLVASGSCPSLLQTSNSTVPPTRSLQQLLISLSRILPDPPSLLESQDTRLISSNFISHCFPTSTPFLPVSGWIAGTVNSVCLPSARPHFLWLSWLKMIFIRKDTTHSACAFPA